jgi:hypothetical protein
MWAIVMFASLPMNGQSEAKNSGVSGADGFTSSSSSAHLRPVNRNLGLFNRLYPNLSRNGNDGMMIKIII